MESTSIRGDDDIPLVSIVIPVFNRRELVCESIESVLKQNWPRVETIVVDDGSTDGVAEHLCHRYGNRIAVIRQSHSGQSAARNLGFRSSHGSMLTTLDSDDLLPPGSIRARARTIQFHVDSQASNGRRVELQSGVRARSSRYRFVANRQNSPKGDLLAFYLRCSFVCHLDVMFRRELLPCDGNLNDPRLRSLEDYFMLLRLLCLAHFSPSYAVTTLVRRHGGHTPPT